MKVRKLGLFQTKVVSNVITFRDTITFVNFLSKIFWMLFIKVIRTEIVQNADWF